MKKIHVKLFQDLERYHGCPIPDRDQDGVNDELDKCPDQPGPAENQGCPVVKAAIIQTGATGCCQCDV